MAEERDAVLQHYRQLREALLSANHGLSDELLCCGRAHPPPAG